MKAGGWILVVILVGAAAAGAGFWIGKHAHEEKGEADAERASTDPDEKKPVVTVSVAPLKLGRIVQPIGAYGSVVAQPGEVRIVSAPFESRIVKMMVAAGQQVSPGTELVQLESSPDALVGLQESKNSLAAAERDLKLTQQRFNDHLATNAELSAAQVALESAKLKLNSLTQRGVGQSQTLKADAAGLVSKIDVQEGQIVPSGGPIVELVSGSQVQVNLGIDPADVPFVKVGQDVKLTVVGGASGEPVTGKVRLVGQRVDPATRLAPVIVSLPPQSKLMLETFVSAEIERALENVMVVPRDAVLPDDEGGHVVFSIANDHAKKHDVRVGLENDKQTQIISDELKPGDPIVVTGNYHLEDDSEVKVEQFPATTEATTQPAATVPTTEAAQ